MVLRKAKVIDATHLELSSPITAPRGDVVLVSVAEAGDLADERVEWGALSAEGLEGAYNDEEPEYSTDLIRESNAEYTG